MDLRRDGPQDSPLRLALAHGSGAPLDSPFMNRVAEGLAARGVAVVRFDFPYMRSGTRRPPDRTPVLLESWREVWKALGSGGWAVGGKSLGGRMASLLADEFGAPALICLGYPFHPPGQPERVRTEHLETLRTPTLIVQGTRDPFGTPEDVAGYRLSPALELAWIPDGDHSWQPGARSGRTEEGNFAEGLEAVERFLRRSFSGPGASGRS